MIRVEKIRKEFGKNAVALDDINLQIEDSTFIALLGPSGCGKSTISVWCFSLMLCILI